MKLSKYGIVTLVLSMIICFLPTGCKTMQVKNTENIEANVLFKRVMKNAKSLEYVNIATSVMIAGNKMIPSVYIKMNANANYLEKKTILRFSVLSKKLFDIAINSEEMTLINHTASQFITFPVEEINLGKLLGLNFDPIDVAYFLTGNIPYTEEMQVVSFSHNEKQNVLLNLTNSNSEYQLEFDKNGRMVHALANNQFFQPLNIDTLTFSDNEGIIMPQKLKITSDESAVSMTFLVKNVTYEKNDNYEADIPQGYEQIFDINGMKINL
ncbi:MAG: DUF4292 domain-containing protein [Spirochaetales bacterium]|nr:DUF4292 domain-containing protein [Spirochaetales bacterium]